MGLNRIGAAASALLLASSAPAAAQDAETTQAPEAVELADASAATSTETGQLTRAVCLSIETREGTIACLRELREQRETQIAGQETQLSEEQLANQQREAANQRRLAENQRREERNQGLRQLRTISQEEIDAQREAGSENTPTG